MTRRTYRITFAGQVLRNGNRLAAGHRLDWRAGGDVSKERQFHGAPANPRRHELDRPAPVPCALDEALLLQIRQVLVDSRERGQPESSTDFFQARGVAVLLDEVVQVVENLALALRQWLHGRALYAKEKRKSICLLLSNFRPVSLV